MDRPHSLGKSVMFALSSRGRGEAIAGALAIVVGLLLAACFLSPFWGALDRPVGVIETGDDGANNQGIVIEHFDYTEPGEGTAQPEETGASDAQADLVSPPEPAEPAPQEPIGQSSSLSDPGQAAAPTADSVTADAPMRLLPLPVALAAGRIESRQLIIDLEGIAVLPVDTQCTSPSGIVWPCGRHARTAFRQWLRGRAIMCRLPDNAAAQALVTQCRLGNEDAAEWLVENGWAKALPDGAYAEAMRLAEAQKRGIYGEKPASDLPELRHEANPADNTPSLPAAAPVESAPLPEGDFPPMPAPPAGQ
ncbi:thermonuclease family protein [Daeguia caeni]|uniref:Thermonuclease family protein n=1 Tax=Daeguia caeni TaxID=439612 RepID=A0ABV9H7W6_9HYPH